MEGINNTSQPMGVGQPHHPVNHTRPFFYVQPPSQPYFMYQWPMNPYGHYGFPGPALHFGRPYMAPYQFMQYPGYVIPHAPMQPIDYRRINPHYPSVASYDLRVRHHFQNAGMHRETACSEVQTDPSDSVNKLIDKIESLKACELGSDKGPNNVVSSTPDVVQGEKLTCLNEDSNLEVATKECKEDPVTRPTTYSDSAYDAESSQGRLDECVFSDVLPLDSSSVHEEEEEEEKDVNEEDEPQTLADDICSQNEMSASTTSNVFCSGVQSIADPTECHDLEKLGDEQVQDITSADAAAVIEPLISLSEDFDLPYQILRLPCNKTTTGLSLEREIDPLVYFDSPSTLLPPQNYLSSIGSAYSYSYYPQVTQERQSVLSPSIDELSSRDEMFSTDVEDLEVVPGHVYVGGGRLAEASDVPVRSRKELPSVDKTCSVCQKTCACCGSTLQDEVGMCKMAEHSHPERDEMSDQDCDYDLEAEVRSNCESPRVSKRKCCSRHALPSCGHHCAKHRHRKLLCEGQESCDLREQARVHPKGECCEEYGALAKADKRIQKGALCRPCIEQQWREGVVSDQENWASCGAKPRSWRQVTGPQDQGRTPLRRSTCKSIHQQRPRSEYNDYDETEFTYCQRGRGSMKKRGSRY